MPKIAFVAPRRSPLARFLPAAAVSGFSSLGLDALLTQGFTTRRRPASMMPESFTDVDGGKVATVEATVTIGPLAGVLRDLSPPRFRQDHVVRGSFSFAGMPRMLPDMLVLLSDGTVEIRPPSMPCLPILIVRFAFPVSTPPRMTRDGRTGLQALLLPCPSRCEMSSVDAGLPLVGVRATSVELASAIVADLDPHFMLPLPSARPPTSRHRGWRGRALPAAS